MVFIFLVIGSLILTTLTAAKEAIFDRAGHPTYQAMIEKGWRRIDPTREENLEDTTKPICTLFLEGIKITIHNFPGEQRISPQAQVARWKNQLKNLDSANYRIEPVAWGGYAGLFFEGYGESAVLGWALSLPPNHCRLLDDPQARAEVTIKAIGTCAEIQKHREAIIAFATSFELREEIPHR